MDDLRQVAEQFIAMGGVNDIRAYGNGNINDTYLVEVAGIAPEKFILQRVNTTVFKRPQLILENLRTLTEHVQERLSCKGDPGKRRWETPMVRATVSGDDFYICSQRNFWRAFSFIAGARSYDTAQNLDHAREAGYALGRFQHLVSDLDTGKMHDTLVGFHITPQYLQNYDALMQNLPSQVESEPSRYCHRFIESHRNRVAVLEAGKDQGELQTRVIHGDPKINNFMMSKRSGQAVSVVDLDTVKPGLVHYDIGDCLRSACNPLGEETEDFEGVYFDINLARSILEGYLGVACQFLSSRDYDYLYESIWLIPFELGLRFFTDHLAGNVYFKVDHPTHNLDRALVQFKLTESIEAQAADIRAMITNLVAEIALDGVSKAADEYRSSIRSEHDHKSHRG
jgi:hypothetical protein